MSKRKRCEILVMCFYVIFMFGLFLAGVKAISGVWISENKVENADSIVTAAVRQEEMDIKAPVIYNQRKTEQAK